MADQNGGPRLEQEPVNPFRVEREPRTQHFHGADFAEEHVLGEIHGAHAADADGLSELVPVFENLSDQVHGLRYPHRYPSPRVVYPHARAMQQAKLPRGIESQGRMLCGGHR